VPNGSERKGFLSASLAGGRTLHLAMWGRRQEMRSILKKLAVAAVSLGALILAGGAHFKL
jgi:hypothetical protein